MRLLLPAFTLLAFIFCTFVTISGGQSPGQDEKYAGNMTIISKQAAEDFVPGGDLTKNVWKTAVAVTFDTSARGNVRFPEAETTVSSVWTRNFVYFAYRCKYTKLNIYEGESTVKERWELWNRDVVEVFINPEPARFNHYYEYEVAPNNQWIDLVIDLAKAPFNDAKWDSKFEHATRIDEDSRVWNCEMRLPVSAMGVQEIQGGAEWRLNFYRADGPGDDSKRRFISWSPLPGPKMTFHQPASFGIIRFVP
jgi:alpha-galactosidase